jgi:hypothetical protein
MLSRKGLIVLLTLLALSAVWGTLLAQGALADPSAPAAATSPAGAISPGQETGGIIESPAAFLLDSPGPSCYRLAAGTGACTIVWNDLYVTADSGQFIISMTLSIDDRVRAYHSGFFQNYMYIPANMYDRGFKVICGAPGSGGAADMGKVYNYTLRTRQTGGSAIINSGAVTCPADVVRVFLPLSQKR